jgi:hypothetical protein
MKLHTLEMIEEEFESEDRKEWICKAAIVETARRHIQSLYDNYAISSKMIHVRFPGSGAVCVSDRC